MMVTINKWTIFLVDWFFNSSVWLHLYLIFSFIFWLINTNRSFQKQKLHVLCTVAVKFRICNILHFTNDKILNWIERVSIQYIPWCSLCIVHCGLSTEFSFQQNHHSMITISYIRIMKCSLLIAYCLHSARSAERTYIQIFNFKYGFKHSVFSANRKQFKFYHIIIECCRNLEIGSRMLAFFFALSNVGISYCNIISDCYIESWALGASNTKHHLQIH